VRYLDAIFPDDGRQLSNYLSGSVLGLNQRADGGLVHSFSETKFNSGKAVVTARTVVQRGRVGLPPDLHPAVVPIAERFATLDGLHAILDTDASMEGRLAFAVKDVEARLSVVHEEVASVFRAMTTDDAREAWK
jgi:uncharacterized protein (TIGR04255 family)